MGRLDGKVAIVTGSAMGIGQATVFALAREGAKVTVSDINDTEGEATADHIRAAGGQAFFQHADVGSTADMERLVEATVNRYGRLDVMVNNAGVAIPGSVTEISEENWIALINIHLNGTWRGMRFAIPHMIKNGGGSIINMSSVQAIIGFKGWSGYAAAKGAIMALTQQAAIDYGPHNIRVNAIAPGAIMTPMNEKRLAEETDNAEELLALWNSWHALERMGTPEEVANLIVFLASDESTFITGSILKIDGGMTVKTC
jgi:NAD(P)-dependent dehydrogenase (short-subunit alcohol dehydrogenase family)